MAGFNALFSLLKAKIDIPNQKVIVYVNDFGLDRKTVSLICSLCLSVIGIPLYMQHTLPYMVCGDPESGPDHSLKEVSTCIH